MLFFRNKPAMLFLHNYTILQPFLLRELPRFAQVVAHKRSPSIRTTVLYLQRIYAKMAYFFQV